MTETQKPEERRKKKNKKSKRSTENGDSFDFCVENIEGAKK